MTAYSVGILVASDSCASKQSVDQSGLNLKQIVSGIDLYKCDVYEIVPDDIETIKNKLIDWCDNLKLSLILTTGGSGFSPRDVTPEATKQVIEKETQGLSNTILYESLKITKFAMLSRAVSGIRGKTLIINLPGSKKGSQESFEIVQPVLKHALDLINDVKSDIKADHVKIQDPSNDLNKHHHNHHHHHHAAHHHHHHGAHDHHHHHHHHSHKHSNEKSRSGEQPRKSTFPMIPTEEALKIILENSNFLEIEEVNYMNALNRVCAADIIAKDPLPPFAASVKDGFAVRLTEDQKNKLNVRYIFDVVGSSNAGDELINIDLKEGQCVKINTGAPVPFKADAVVQIEDTIALEKDENGKDKRIEITDTSGCGGAEALGKVVVNVGQEIRPIGFDIQVGEVVVREGMIMKAPQIGVCATVGALKVKVYKVPSVSLISTGNELKDPSDPDQTLRGGQIRDSNKSLLHSALKYNGVERVNDAGIASDDINSVVNTFKKAAESSDIIISTGGVSMGDKDLVKDVLVNELGCKIHFARVNLKPGKPTTFVTGEVNGRNKLFFCLPGNPVSSIVTFYLFVLPCIKKLMGYKNTAYPQVQVKCDFEAYLDPRPEYHRGLLEWTNSSPYPIAHSTGNQHSSRLLSMNDANCLVLLPGATKDKTKVEKGEILTALIIDKI